MRKRIKKGILVGSSTLSKDKTYRTWDIQINYFESMFGNKIIGRRLLGLRQTQKIN